MSASIIEIMNALADNLTVVAPKDWDGVRESTALSRSFADQGVRIRLRKESRHSTLVFFQAPRVFTVLIECLQYQKKF